MGIDDVFKFDAHVFSALNRFGLCNVQTGLFPTGNTRATVSSSSESRSESAIAINPRNRRNMIGTSKKFIDLRSTSSESA